MNTVVSRFVARQHQELLALAADSENVEVAVLDVDRFLVTLHVKTLISPVPGVVTEADTVVFGLWIHEGYLDIPEPAVVVTLLEPRNVFHSNIRGPLVCLGPIAAGTPMVDLVARAHELFTFNEFTTDEHDALNHAACRWIRRHLDCLPLDWRPLKYRTRRPGVGAEIEKTGTPAERGSVVTPAISRIGIIEIEQAGLPAAGVQR